MSSLLAHRVDGSGEPLLLLNGGMMSIVSWEPLLAPFAAYFRVVRCDFRGQFLSPGEPPPTLDGHIDDLVALLDALGIARAHVIGTSFGGEVGLLLAAHHPGRVASLIVAAVTDVTPAPLRAASAELRAACRTALAGGDKGRIHDLLVRPFYSRAYREAHAGELATRRAQVALLPDTWFSAAERLLASLDDLDLRPDLGRIACPTLVIAAAGDEIMPLERARALAAAVPGARLEIVEGSGHVLVVERSDRFVELCLSFLATVVETASPHHPSSAKTTQGGRQ